VGEIILDFPAYQPKYLERIHWFHDEFIAPHRRREAA
jgi:hypothetical protein